MVMPHRRQSPRNIAARAVSGSPPLRMRSLRSDQTAVVPRPVGANHAQMDQNITVPFSRHIDIDEMQSQIHDFWSSRMEQFRSSYVPKAKTAGCPVSYDHACIAMVLLKPFFPKMTIFDGLYVLHMMDQEPNNGDGIVWSLAEKTLIKRTKIEIVHQAYYKPSNEDASDDGDDNDSDSSEKTRADPGLTWDSAAQNRARNDDEWNKQMDMIAEIAVAIEASSGLNLVEKALQGVEIYDRANPTDVKHYKLACRAAETPARILARQLAAAARERQNGGRRGRKRQTPAPPAPARNVSRKTSRGVDASMATYQAVQDAPSPSEAAPVATPAVGAVAPSAPVPTPMTINQNINFQIDASLGVPMDTPAVQNVGFAVAHTAALALTPPAVGMSLVTNLNIATAAYVDPVTENLLIYSNDQSAYLASEALQVHGNLPPLQQQVPQEQHVAHVQQEQEQVQLPDVSFVAEEPDLGDLFFSTSESGVDRYFNFQVLS